jgi:hypothetical protein
LPCPQSFGFPSARAWNFITWHGERERILKAVQKKLLPAAHSNLFGAGDASQKIVRLLESKAG